MRPATGAERAALVLIALGEKHGAPLWSELDDAEIEAVTAAMVRLGQVEETFVNAAVDLFAGSLRSGAISGTLGSTEKLLRGVLPEERAVPLLARIRQPGGPNVWERLSALNAKILADYLAGEHPQTVAVVLSRLPVAQAASVLKAFDPTFALHCLSRLARPASVDNQALAAVEQALGASLAGEADGPSAPDPAAGIADIFNLIDREAGDRLLDLWREADADTAGRVRSLMFTFEDFSKLEPFSAQVILRVLDRDLLALALKGAGDEQRAFFMNQMSSRAARMFEDQMSALGPVRRRDVESARIKVVSLAKDLIASGEIRLPASAETEAEEMIE